MRINDYTVISQCDKCGKPILTPAFWIGKGKDGTQYPRPKYKTCRHQEERR